MGNPAVVFRRVSLPSNEVLEALSMDPGQEYALDKEGVGVDDFGGRFRVNRTGGYDVGRFVQV